MSIPLSNLNLKYEIKPIELEIGVLDGKKTLQVFTYLPQAVKGDFIKFVMDCSFDERTGFYSPLRLETYFMLAIAQWYGQIEFSENELMKAPEIYDLLQINGVMDAIISAIPKDEFDYIQELVSETAENIQKYNTSAAGIISSMGNNAETLDEQLNTIMKDLKDKKGIEELLTIRDVMKDNFAPQEDKPVVTILQKSKNS